MLGDCAAHRRHSGHHAAPPNTWHIIGYTRRVDVRSPSPRRRLVLSGLALLIVAVACAAVLAAAVLVPAPTAVVPLIVLLSIGAPVATAFDLAGTIASLREPHAQLRRDLELLPETPHPLGY